jgi:hypothetical protein
MAVAHQKRRPGYWSRRRCATQPHPAAVMVFCSIAGEREVCQEPS